MATSLAEYTLEDLQRLERERPELGKVELVGEALHATGESATGDRHQACVGRIYALLLAAVPATQVLRLDTYWFAAEGTLRPDLALWRAADRPADGGAFRLPPLAVAEVLSADRDHDLVTKAAVYAAHGVDLLVVDPAQVDGWWCRAGGSDVREARTTWQPAGWPEPVMLSRDGLVDA